MKTFENIGAGIISIGRDCYVKTPEARDMLLAELRGTGYKVEDLRQSERRRKDRVSVEQMEREGWSLWFASLDCQRGKCGSCHEYISLRGIRMHGHACEKCGAVTYREIIDGTVIRFRFPHLEGDASMVDIKMRALRWDTDAGFLYLHPEVSCGLWTRTDEDALEYFRRHEGVHWTPVMEDGALRIRVGRALRDPDGGRESDIEVSDIHGHEWNHEIVRVWEGNEYPEHFGDFPVPEMLSVYETWHWAPLAPSPMLHRRVLRAIHNHDDKGWHYQDGRPWFSRRSFFEMGKFIEHFTALDAAAWHAKIDRFRLDGPGGIDDVAAFCSPHAVVRNEPNIGNAIEAVGKLAGGRRLTEGEIEAAGAAFADPEASELIEGTPLQPFGRVFTSQRRRKR